MDKSEKRETIMFEFEAIVYKQGESPRNKFIVRGCHTSIRKFVDQLVGINNLIVMSAYRI